MENQLAKKMGNDMQAAPVLSSTLVSGCMLVGCSFGRSPTLQFLNMSRNYSFPDDKPP